MDLPISLPSTSISSGTNRMNRNLTGRETSMVFGMLMALASLTNAVIGLVRQGRAPTRSTAPSAPTSMHARIDSFRSLAFSSTSSEASRGEDTGTLRSLGVVEDISSTISVPSQCALDADRGGDSCDGIHKDFKFHILKGQDILSPP